MIADLFSLMRRRTAAEYEQAFVAAVRVRRPPQRDRRVERIILICWILIAIKHVGVIWACHHWPVPFHQLWINAPTWMLGVVATLAYYQTEE
jgi:hypothetical protein